MMKMSSFVALIGGILLSLSDVVFGCGLDWTLPAGPYAPLGNNGELSYWEQIGTTIDPSGRKIPLYIGFSSLSQYVSSTLGRGWSFALFDSRIEQVDDNTFRLYQPDGQVTDMRRDAKNPDIIGGGGWRAELKQNVIICKADCGWSMTFEKGRLTSIGTPENNTYAINLDISGKYDLSCNGKSILSLEPDPQSPTEILNLIGAEGAAITIKLKRRPVISAVNGQKVISSLAPGLEEIDVEGIPARHYEIGVTSSMDPTLTTSHGTFRWDPASLQLLDDGKWTYSQVKFMDVNCWKRTDAKGATEMMGKDDGIGRKISQISGWPIYVTDYFTSGVLTGKTRAKTKINADGSSEVIEKYLYDENGNIIKGSLVSGQDKSSFKSIDGVQYKYAEPEHKLIWEKHYDNSGRIVQFISQAANYTITYEGGDSVRLRRNKGDKSVEIKITKNNLNELLGEN